MITGHRQKNRGKTYLIYHSCPQTRPNLYPFSQFLPSVFLAPLLSSNQQLSTLLLQMAWYCNIWCHLAFNWPHSTQTGLFWSCQTFSGLKLLCLAWLYLLLKSFPPSLFAFKKKIRYVAEVFLIKNTYKCYNLQPHILTCRDTVIELLNHCVLCRAPAIEYKAPYYLWFSASCKSFKFSKKTELTSWIFSFHLILLNITTLHFYIYI